MEVAFPKAGVARYQLYTYGDGNVRENLTTAAAALIIARAMIKAIPGGRKLGPAW